MGTALSVLERLLAPLQTLVDWITGAPPPADITCRPRSPAIHPAAARTCPSWSAPPRSRRENPRRALRVVRVAEGCPSPSGAGRLIISGRMADVCAELDRLAALEAAG